MQTTTLGSTGIQISRICLGTMTWGNGQMGNAEEANAHAQMDYALAQGVNFWDTAEMYAVPPSAETYGKTETLMGTWFAKTGRRSQVVLASKIAGVGRPYIRNGAPITAAALRPALEGSLKRLQTDYIDLYQLHWPNRPYPHHQQHWTFAPTANAAQEVETQHAILEELTTLIKEGKIRAYGYSNDTSWGLLTATRLAEKFSLARPASVQNEYSLLYRNDDGNMEETCTYENIAYLPYSSLAVGILSGKYSGGAVPANTRIAMMGGHSARLNPTSLAAADAYIALAKKHGLDPCQMALAFTLARPFVTSTIIGATNLEQLKVDIAAYAVKLSPEVMAGIDTIRRQYPQPY
jgi:aryl-alcohol dehydrogenase-like predicted oxidoreductase